MIKSLIITTHGIAKELNPFGEVIIESSWETDFMYYLRLSQWRVAEASLKEYKIVDSHRKEKFKHNYTAGSIRSCEVNEETLTAVVLDH